MQQPFQEMDVREDIKYMGWKSVKTQLQLNFLRSLYECVPKWNCLHLIATIAAPFNPKFKIGWIVFAKKDIFVDYLCENFLITKFRAKKINYIWLLWSKRSRTPDLGERCSERIFSIIEFMNVVDQKSHRLEISRLQSLWGNTLHTHFEWFSNFKVYCE